MFEQAVLPSRPAGGRYWAVVAGFTSEMLAVGLVLLAPLIWPQLLPRAETLTWILLPSPPPPPAKAAPPMHSHPARPWNGARAVLIQPVTIPATTPTIDEPPPETSTDGVAGGIHSAVASAALGLVESIVRIAPPLHHVAETPAAAAVKPTLAPPQIIRRGGEVQMALLVHRVDPVYPLLARQARISGVVELLGVIGTDGRIRELQVQSGHPLLAKAALEAVRQWIYKPTLLNGKPVEVMAPIRVTFRLQ